MPSLNFKPEFADAVRTAEKTQTIRLKRNPAIKAGDILYLWVNKRTKNAQKLAEVIVTSIDDVSIEIVESKPVIYLNNIPLHPVHYNNFAQKDGFKNADDFF